MNAVEPPSHPDIATLVETGATIKLSCGLHFFTNPSDVEKASQWKAGHLIHVEKLRFSAASLFLLFNCEREEGITAWSLNESS